MGYRELAREIKKGYNELKKNTVYKLHHVAWNEELGTSEITVGNDAEFKAVIIGNTNNMSKSRGYMYLFYTNDRNVPFPTIKEIERRLRIVADKEILTDDDAAYFDWEEYGSLERQREYFSEIIMKAIGGQKIMGRCSKYREIRCDFFDEEEKKYYVDAWETDCDDEEGTVIAKISTDGTVEYIDRDAVTDKYAQEIIKETCSRIMQESSRIYTHDEAAEITEMFEDILDRYNIMVPSPEDGRKEDGNNARLHGSIVPVTETVRMSMDCIMRLGFMPELDSTIKYRKFLLAEGCNKLLKDNPYLDCCTPEGCLNLPKNKRGKTVFGSIVFPISVIYYNFRHITKHPDSWIVNHSYFSHHSQT